MKAHNNPIDDRRTDGNGLVTKYKTIRRKPAWIKTRRFFWAVGVVLLEAFVALMSGVEAASKTTGNAHGDEDSDEIDHHDPQTGAWRNSQGNIVCGSNHDHHKRF